MRHSGLFLGSLWVLSTGAVTAPTVQAVSAPHIAAAAAYQVWGTSVKRPRDDRPWSDVCPDNHTAHRRLSEILGDYSDHGLLAAASDKPLRLRVVTLKPRPPELSVQPLAAASVDRRCESEKTVKPRQAANRSSETGA